MSTQNADFDVIIVGAGLSGIGAAYRLMTECPTKSFTILEARDAIGGTWDLFRYPGVRSDSDMFTLGYPFHPWTAAKAIADGPSILEYIRETSTKFGIDPHIRYKHRIVHASWSTDACQWTLEAEVTGSDGSVEKKTYRCKFLYLCAGYYNYDKAHDPGFAGVDRYRGKVVHPQWWPEDLDYTDKRVIVIGSGATAVTIVPAMAEKAKHVTMLQRSPSYITSLPASDVIADKIRAFLPANAAHSVVRTKNMLMSMGLYQFCRRQPKLAAKLLKKGVRSFLPKDYEVDTHFQPRYNPWDQRLCLVPDGDLFKPIREGKATVVTDSIDTFTENGIRLKSGTEIEADIVVTATGLRIQPVGGVKFTVDGKQMKASDLLVYKGLMLSGIPNLAWCVGYTNASWTLRADLTSRYVCRLLNLMDKRGYDIAIPTVEDDGGGTRPLLDLNSGYVTRAESDLPKQGNKTPWYLRQNYVLDFMSMRLGRVDDSMTFAKHV